MDSGFWAGAREGSNHLRKMLFSDISVSECAGLSHSSNMTNATRYCWIEDCKGNSESTSACLISYLAHQVVVSLNYCSQNGGNLYRAPYYNGNPNIGPRIIRNLDQYPGGTP